MKGYTITGCVYLDSDPDALMFNITRDSDGQKLHAYTEAARGKFDKNGRAKPKAGTVRWAATWSIPLGLNPEGEQR